MQLSPNGQDSEQLPQNELLVVILTQVPPHTWKLPLFAHWSAQTPLEHSWPGAQNAPHAPQLVVDVWRFTQMPSGQRVWLVGQVEPHCPALQT